MVKQTLRRKRRKNHRVYGFNSICSFSLLNFRKNAELFEEAFYEKKNLDPQMHVQQENNNATVADEVDPELLAKVLANPEMRALLNSLAKTMK